jgi:hypothetical protein
MTQHLIFNENIKSYDLIQKSFTKQNKINFC